MLHIASGYVAERLAASPVHMTYNNPSHRGIGFILGVLFTLALWVTLAMAIIARL